MHEKVRCDDATFSCGGSAGNTACWLASLGVHTGVAGTVGDDALGRAQLDDLRKYSVDTTYVCCSNQSGVAVILVEGEAKRMIKYTGANKYKQIGEYLTECNHVHLSSNDRETVEKVIDACNGNVTLSWDPQELLFENLIPSFDYIFINEDDLKRKTHINDITRAAQAIDSDMLIVTKNGGGCLIFSDPVIDVPSFGVKAADSTGAGDAFDAGFIFGLQNHVTLRECGILGTACASIKVQHYSARAGICSRDQLEIFLQGHSVQINTKK